MATVDSAGRALILPKWKCHKVVSAASIMDYQANTIMLETGDVVTAANGMFARYTPQPGDYYVVYEDGYASISPKKAFEDGYTRMED